MLHNNNELNVSKCATNTANTDININKIYDLYCKTHQHEPALYLDFVLEDVGIL